MKTTLSTIAEHNSLAGLPVVHTTQIEVPDAAAAQQYQKEQIHKELGPYSERTNSCVDHISNVLRAGGVNFPEGPGGQAKFLAKKGFKLKVR